VLAAPTKGWMRLAWLAPGLATTMLTLALATRLGVRRAAGAVAGGWLVLVIIVAQATDDATAPFRVVGQVGALVVAAAAGAVVITGRRRLDRWSDA